MRLAMFTAAALCCAAPALAADPVCHKTSSYLVAGTEYDDDVGTQFIVTPRSGSEKTRSCTAEPAANSFIIGEPGDPLWFAGMSGHYLALTRSTGPDGDVVIYDLADPATPVVDVPGRDIAIDAEKIAYWERVREGTADDCPSFAENTANGLGSAIFAEMRLTLKTGKVGRTGAQACHPTQ